MRKFIFYGSFCALGVFWAEGISTNYPLALINPFLYLGYGFLYVLFIDALMRRQEASFAIWYLFGMLVGLITETYIAKVTFFGLNPAGFRWGGVAPGAIAFVILFYHAFFSFLLPAYLAKRVLKFPFAIAEKKGIDLFYLGIPLLLIPMVQKQMVERGMDVFHLMRSLAISAFILCIWVLMLSSIGKIEDVLLSSKERKGLLCITGFVYLLFLFKGTNQAHGHAPMDFPLVPMMAISAFIFVLLFLLFHSLKQEEDSREEVAYSSSKIDLPLFFMWIAWHLSITGIALVVIGPLQPLMKISLIFLGLGGMAIGIFSALFSFVMLVKKNL